MGYLLPLLWSLLTAFLWGLLFAAMGMRRLSEPLCYYLDALAILLGQVGLAWLWAAGRLPWYGVLLMALPSTLVWLWFALLAARKHPPELSGIRRFS